MKSNYMKINIFFNKKIILILFVFLLFSCNIGRGIIYHPKKIDPARINFINKNYFNVEQLDIKTDDGSNLSGWFLKNGPEDKTPLIIYFGGNGEELSWNIDQFLKISDYNTALINYRGYGNSTGTQSEENFFSDALAIYDYLKIQKKVKPENILVFGRSLGSGVAVYLASKREVGGMILVTPYDSINEVAKGKAPAILVYLFLQERYDSKKYIRDVRCRVLLIAAEKDTVIPVVHAENLYKLIVAHRTYVLIKGAGHNDIVHFSEYEKTVTGFLKR